ncbi:MAG: hypothetical protein AAGK00_02575 [Pseudomonadota bacterium]
MSEMGSKNHRLFEELTQDEQASLERLCGSACRNDIPVDHAHKFLGMGLAEVTCGGLGPTRTGKQAIARRSH